MKTEFREEGQNYVMSFEGRLDTPSARQVERDMLVLYDCEGYCNAGHKAPLVDGQPLPVDRNLPIGAMPDVAYTQQETTLAPGTTLFLYTDGLDEAEDAGHRLFGKKRIYEIMQTTSQQPRTLIERMTQAVADFVGDTEQSDDLTMLAIQRPR